MSSYSAFFAYNTKDNEMTDDFGWWKPIMGRFIDRGESFRIECRESDEEGLNSCAKLGAQNLADVNIEGSVEVWEGDMNDRFKYEFINEPLSEFGIVKWHTVVLKSRNKTFMCCAHYGREFSVYDISEEDLAFLAQSVMGYPFTLYTWDSVASGQEVSFSPLYGRDTELDAIINEFKRSQKR